MSDTIEIGVIEDFEKNRNYSTFEYSEFEEWNEKIACYNCVSFPYDFINELTKYYKTVDTYASQYGRNMLGIDVCGDTLIPPSSISTLIEITNQLMQGDIINDKPNLKKIISLFQMAKSNNKYIICFGI